MAGSGDEGSAVRDWELIRRTVTDTRQRILAKVTDGTFVEASFSVLSALLHAPDRRLPMSQLAREASMTTGGFTRLADRLGRAGLIDRRGSKQDRRVIYATLTPAGLREARRLEKSYRAALREEVLGLLSARELRLVADTLRVLDADVGILSEQGTLRDESARGRRRRAEDRGAARRGDEAERLRAARS